jgi:hypothetical protein
MPTHILIQHNNNGSNTMVFDSDYMLHTGGGFAFWVNESRRAGLRYELIKLCKRHQNCKGLQRHGKCCKVIEQG